MAGAEGQNLAQVLGSAIALDDVAPSTAVDEVAGRVSATAGLRNNVINAVAAGGAAFNERDAAVPATVGGPPLAGHGFPKRSALSLID